MPLQTPAFAMRIPSAWRIPRARLTVADLAVFALVIGALTLIALGGRQTLTALPVAGEAITLDPRALPGYALRTILRMLAAMGLSVLATFVFGFWAAKSRRAEMVIIPLVDVMQSVPVLAFQALTLVFFLGLFPGRTLGAELAAVFLVFTSQAWNMVFSFYHSCRTVPKDLTELSDSLRLGAWRRLWTLEAPYAAPQLIWNAMISMSGAWFFVVANEAFDVGVTHIALPGVGSYVALAIAHKDLAAIGWALLTMLLVIVAYDQLIFRPLVAWSQKFRTGDGPEDPLSSRSWALDFMRRAALARRVLRPAGSVMTSLASVRVGRPLTVAAPVGRMVCSRTAARVGLGAITLLRVMVLVLVASLIWVPVGVWIGLRPRWSAAVQPVAQFLAAFPNNLFFPLVVVGIVHFRLAPDLWLTPLMILGTQWYILFNVIAGASAFPNDLRQAAASLRIRGWAWWRKVMLPGVAPYFVTGALTASGGSWNASVVAEVASWGHDKLEAHGLGAFIADATTRGDTPRVVLGVAVMSAFVVLFNRALWRPLFTLASRRLRLD